MRRSELSIIGMFIFLVKSKGTRNKNTFTCLHRNLECLQSLKNVNINIWNLYCDYSSYISNLCCMEDGTEYMLIIKIMDYRRQYIEHHKIKLKFRETGKAVPKICPLSIHGTRINNKLLPTFTNIYIICRIYHYIYIYIHIFV